MVSGLTRRQLLGALPAASLPMAMAPIAPARAQDRSLSVIVLGQAVVARDLREPPYPDFTRVATLLRNANACAVDLVAAIRGPNAGGPEREPGAARTADAAALDALKALGVNLLALANSHTYDLNASGIADLIAAARARDLTIAGAGIDLAGANAAGYRTSPDGKVALVSVATGEIRTGSAASDNRPGINAIPRLATGDLNPLEIERVTSQIHAAAENADVAIFYHHHESAERDGRPRMDWLQRVARRAIEAGAGIAVAAGLPHVQGVELYRGRPIFYGLGNFVLQTPGEHEPEMLQSVAARCTYAGDALRQIELLPIQLTGERAEDSEDIRQATRGRPALPDTAAAAAILARVAERSQPYNTTITVADGVGRIGLQPG